MSLLTSVLKMLAVIFRATLYERKRIKLARVKIPHSSLSLLTVQLLFWIIKKRLCWKSLVNVYSSKKLTLISFVQICIAFLEGWNFGFFVFLFLKYRNITCCAFSHVTYIWGIFFDPMWLILLFKWDVKPFVSNSVVNIVVLKSIFIVYW